MSGAKNVTANDIDKHALEAVKMNLAMNSNTSINMADITRHHQILSNNFFLNDKNFLTLEKRQLHILMETVMYNPIDVLTLGDMFYDEEIVELIFQWMSLWIKIFPQTRIFLGDPGRGFINQHQIFKHLKTVQVYEMPACVNKEHYSCGSVSVLEWNPTF
uniref:Electron transfer flavoprotein beta subunit lysine methyltransferase n=1 Tax=Phallusia mammillata TaxID=59560 RepID=A0A6F9DLD1_9ASCI|nr:methyltransferase-like protein 5 [Phallusia mammillata]